MNLVARCALTTAIVVGSVGPGAMAQTVTVDTLFDVSDFGGQQRVADLPGADGRVSFREAVTAANNTAGPQTIEFAIPTDEWWLVDDIALLELQWGAFVIRDDATTIDFSTQTDFTGDTNPNGTEVGIYGLEGNGWGTPAIIIGASDCVIRGLGNVWQRGHAIAIWAGHRNRIVGCVTTDVEIDPYPEHSTFNVIGGTDPEDGNTLQSVSLVCGADDNLVIGNHVKTVFVGASPYCDTSSRNRIGGPTPAERNVINGFGSYSGEGFPIGAGVEVSWATDTLIEGNYIGVNESGTARVPQTGPVGVDISDSDSTTVRDNLIAGLWVRGRNHHDGRTFGEAIRVNSINRDNLGTVIENNRIGTDHTGLNPILTRNGIVVSQFTGIYSPHGTRIGGTEPGQGNLVAFCEIVGIGIGPLIEDAEISGNSIHSNAGIGIDLSTWAGFDGVTQNDPGDGDTQGGNLLQNFPVLTAATSSGGVVHVEGLLNSSPSRAYRVEFFANAVCDPTGYGEGEVFLGAVEVTTDAQGDAVLTADLSGTVPENGWVTATATDIAQGATSEFAACVQAETGCVADFNGDGDVNTLDVLTFLNAWNAEDPSADIDGDGDVNTLDVLAFLNLWNAGC